MSLPVARTLLFGWPRAPSNAMQTDGKGDGMNAAPPPPLPLMPCYLCAAGEKKLLKAQFDEDMMETLHITQVRPAVCSLDC